VYVNNVINLVVYSLSPKSVIKICYKLLILLYMLFFVS